MTSRLSITDELFAVRLLELARRLEPEGNRVEFTRRCESHGIRSFLQRFPEVWTKIIDDPPREGITHPREHRIRCAAFALKTAAFQEELFKGLRSREIRVLSIKGFSLSMLLYGDISEREFGDLDLLVSPEDARRGVKALEEMGLRRSYPPVMKAGQELALVRYNKAQTLQSPSGGTVDFHWRLLSSWIGDDLLEFEDLWARSQTLHRDGLTPWRTLSNEDTIVFLALHGFQDGWPKLKQFLDLAVALEVLDYDWDKVLAYAGYRAVLVERAVELCVRLLDVAHPGNMTFHYLDQDQACRAWTAMARDDKSPQTALLRPSLWSCSSGEAISRSVQALLNPAIDDIQSVALPSSLIGLYPAVRFFRLIQKSFQRRSLR
jgi:hypothetical protein